MGGSVKGKLEKSKKPAVKKSVAKQTVSVSKKTTTAKVAVKTVSVKDAPAIKAVVPPPAPAVKVKPLSKKEAKAKAAETAIPDVSIKRPAKLFFIEVKPGSERVIKRGDKSLATPPPLDIQARRKDTATEETSEELVERIERELQHQSFFKHNALKPQMCTKCGVNVVAERFTIDRELGYCLDCADILRLGATKEARRMEFVAKKEEGAEAGEAGEIQEPAASEIEEEAVPDID